MHRKHPNVIFIITDDQGYGDLSYHGNPILETPNLDAMAARSVSLNNHHHDPLCSPSRAALMTGRYATRTGVWHVTQGRQLLNRNETTMADIFAMNGYRTAMFGKWHLGDTYPYAPQYRGFEEVVKHNGGGVGEIPDYWGNNYIDDTYFHNGEPEAYAGYCTDVFFREAIHFIREHQDQPFFIYLATNAMHSPFIVPEEYAAPYLEQDIPERRAHFYGMIANFDENMGRLFDSLTDLGLEEDTIVIFTSDHGTAAGYDPQTNHGYNAGMRGKKGSIYDGGHRVAFFMQWQGGSSGRRTIESVTGHIDVLPTLIDLCQLDTPIGLSLDGISLRPLLNTSEGDLAIEWPERTLFVHLQPDQPEKWHHCVVISDRWRLINGTALYDMALDPGQTSDFAEQYPDIVTQLRQAYETWWDEISPAFAGYCYFSLGASEENPTLLTAREWHPIKGDIPWMQEWLPDDSRQANGFWAVEIVQEGLYSFTLRRYPRGVDLLLGATHARFTIGDIDKQLPVSKNALEVVFDLHLNVGQSILQTWLIDEVAGIQRGAYYVYVEHHI